MNKIKYLFTIGLFTLFIPRVYALSYNINTDTEFSVNKGTKIDINVSIDNINNSTDGISVCSMNILFDENIELVSPIRTLGSWSMTTGSMYLFDTGSPVLDTSDMFTIPVRVNGEGTINLNNIVCSDGVEEVEISNKEINFYIEDEVTNDDGNGNNNKPNNNTGNNNDIGDNKQEVEKSNCNLSDIELNEGSIEFDPNVTEYEVEISNFDDFKVTPKLEDNSSSYVIDKNITDDSGSFVITVNGLNGDFKIYTLYVKIGNGNIKDTSEDNNSYIPIFIGIIVLLVLINIIRIIRNIIKNKGQN